MKKENQTKLALGKETIMSLSSNQMSSLHGGATKTPPNGPPQPPKDPNPPRPSGIDCISVTGH